MKSKGSRQLLWVATWNDIVTYFKYGIVLILFWWLVQAMRLMGVCFVASVGVLAEHLVVPIAVAPLADHR